MMCFATPLALKQWCNLVLSLSPSSSGTGQLSSSRVTQQLRIAKHVSQILSRARFVCTLEHTWNHHFCPGEHGRRGMALWSVQTVYVRQRLSMACPIHFLYFLFSHLWFFCILLHAGLVWRWTAVSAVPGECAQPCRYSLYVNALRRGIAAVWFTAAQIELLSFWRIYSSLFLSLSLSNTQTFPILPNTGSKSSTI